MKELLKEISETLNNIGKCILSYEKVFGEPKHIDITFDTLDENLLNSFPLLKISNICKKYGYRLLTIGLEKTKASPYYIFLFLKERDGFHKDILIGLYMEDLEVSEKDSDRI